MAKKSKSQPSLKLEDLVDSGLQLTKDQATRLLPHISKISQHGQSGYNEVEFEDDVMHTRQEDFSRRPNLTAEDGNHTGPVANGASTDDEDAYSDRHEHGNHFGKASQQFALDAQDQALNESFVDKDITGKAKDKNDARGEAEDSGKDASHVKADMDTTDPVVEGEPKLSHIHNSEENLPAKDESEKSKRDKEHRKADEEREPKRDKLEADLKKDKDSEKLQAKK